MFWVLSFQDNNIPPTYEPRGMKIEAAGRLTNDLIAGY